jgi:predicted ATPase
VGPFLVDVRADDERVIRAIRDLAIDDTAVESAPAESESAARRCSAPAGPAEAVCALVLSTAAGSSAGPLPPRENAAAVFEDVELHASESKRTLVVGRGSIVEFDAAAPAARGFVASLHVLHPWIVAHRIFTLSVIELMRGLGACYLHAGCVSDGEKGILLCGASGGGKSTLTYALARAGFAFLSDDGVFLRRAGSGIEVFSWPEKLKLDRTSCSFFEELRAYADTKQKTEIPLRETAIERIAKRAIPAAVVVPARTALGASEIAAIARRDAFARLLAQTIPLLDPAAMNAQLEILSDLVTGCPCYELRAATDFNRIPGLVREAVFSTTEAVV